MISLFVQPLPNEHIFSWLVRLHQRSGYAHFLYFQKQIGIEDRFLHANKVFSLTSKKLVSLLDDANKAIVNNTSASIWIISLERGQFHLGEFVHMNEQQLFGFDTSWHSCKKCRDEDLKNYGTSYWHSQHQLPSVFECYKHHLTLEQAQESVKNLYTEVLPHDVCQWQSVINRSHNDLDIWQAFVLMINALSLQNPQVISELKKRIIQTLNLDTPLLAVRKAKCEQLNPSFEASLGPVLLSYLFRDYSRQTLRGKTNILASMFANIHQTKGERNPIYWIALAYWLRPKLGL
ncbi:TniQ family protein [Aliivibrio kagoshimensis]|uniref:TniQ family protein n=1 Tax=Aliivibrio kagoshimensis TaxID=2910230 RepID=UPI003D0EECD7